MPSSPCGGAGTLRWDTAKDGLELRAAFVLVLDGGVFEVTRRPPCPPRAAREHVEHAFQRVATVMLSRSHPQQETTTANELVVLAVPRNVNQSLDAMQSALP